MEEDKKGGHENFIRGEKVRGQCGQTTYLLIEPLLGQGLYVVWELRCKQHCLRGVFLQCLRIKKKGIDMIDKIEIL